MPFDWTTYLALAKELGKRSDDAALRSAISRAYYAAYNQARLHLSREGTPIPMADSHRALWRLYRTASDPKRQEIGRLGDELRRFRRQADYDDHIPNLSNYVTTTLATAESLLKSLDKLT